ncbi:MAG: UPF0182 family protein [Balneolaceae bacterium]|nr:UPF0182 family protein [Balneolaceae bacterium]
MAKSLKPKSSLKFWIGAIFVFILIIGALSDWIVEWLWLDNLGYDEVFWTIKKTQILLFTGAFGIALLYVLPNMHYLAKRFQGISFANSPLAQLNLDRFSFKQVRNLLFTIGTLISFFFSFAFFMRWDSYFRFHWSETFGQVDPIFGHDLGFYLFRLPFIEIIQNSIIVLVFFITLILLVFYVYSGSLSIQGTSNIQARSTVTKHLSLNIGFWLLLMSWGYYLERYNLLYNQTGVVFGAGYTDLNVVLPTLWVMCILCLLLAGIAFFQFYKAKFKWLIVGGLATIVIGFLGQGLLPTAVQKFMVEPNELQLESPHLEENIKQTRQAYKLDQIQEREYNARDTLTWPKLQQNTATLQNIRLWDPRLVIQTYRQLQEIRLYYQFYNVTLDRYQTEEGYLQMMVAARELSDELPAQANTWVNRHLQYTHGYGLVMSPVAQIGAQGDPRMIIKDLPPVSELDLKVEQAGIYYGDHDPSYKLVNTNIKELDYPSGDENIYTNYDGAGGISIDGFFEKVLFSWKFGDINLFLTDYIREGSKIQFWRSVSERVRRIAPFLEFQDDPYMVLVDGKLKWIQDAYTTSPHYPYSERFNGQLNYIRNSVKVVVDAYNGTVDFYAVDDEDPILSVYRDIFPDMFKPLDEMPEGIKSHIKYPEMLFEVQMEIFNTYHMTDPQVFYNNEDLWTRPNEKYGGQQIKMEPYYVLSKLPGDDELQYILISPLTPNNRDNMIAWMAAKSDFPQYGEVEVFKLPKERLIFGPAQIEAKIDQDTEISRQLALWDQRGSRVIRGNLMIIPIEDSFIYVEPVFLIAEGVDIPQLQRVIVTVGERVVMEPTLDLALESLFGEQPEERIMASTEQIARPDSAQIQDITSQPSPAISAEWENFKTLWNEAQEALRNGDWELFGQKMDEIESLLDNNDN